MTVRPAWRVATFTDADDGACTYAHCTLREAITAANAQPNTDTVRIVNTAATTITLASALPVISTGVHIVGPGVALLTLNADGSATALRRALEFNGAFTASVTGVTVRGGVADAGGGIAISGSADVSLTDVAIVQNEARTGDGGGLQVSGAIARMLRVVIDSNRVSGASRAGGGLSIVSTATVTMTGGRVSFNTVNDGFGGGVRVFNSTLTMDVRPSRETGRWRAPLAAAACSSTGRAPRN